jgi:thiosulfate/3-mercaptopyruvate sulfurtransferase
LRALFQRAGATDNKSVIVYCMIGMRASVAYFVSRYLGYDTKFYDGSWVDWSARQLPAVKGGEPVK